MALLFFKEIESLLLMVALLKRATWEIRSRLLFFKEQQEQIPHSGFFLKINESKEPKSEKANSQPD